MPFTIHEQAVKKQMSYIISRPQEQVPEVLPENWQSTVGQGLPVKQIPHLKFPRVVYKHPKKPFREVQHRNDRFEVVSTDLVPTDHLTKLINNETELKAALSKGWRREPYIPAAAPSVEDDIYGSDEEVQSLPSAPKRSTRGTAENPL